MLLITSKTEKLYKMTEMKYKYHNNSINSQYGILKRLNGKSETLGLVRMMR
jgi:hypothetical protein